MDRRNFAVLTDDFRLVLQLCPDDIERALQPFVDIGVLPFGFVDMGELLQVLDNLLHSRQAVLRFLEQGPHIFTQEVEIGFGLGCLDRVRCCRRRELLIGVDDDKQLFDVALQGAEVGIDEADRIVDLMGDARCQLADGRHLFRLQQLVLRFFHLLQQCLQLLLFLCQLAIGFYQLLRARGNLFFQVQVCFRQVLVGRRENAVELVQSIQQR